jgi:hypothetical protein
MKKTAFSLSPLWALLSAVGLLGACAPHAAEVAAAAAPTAPGANAEAPPQFKSSGVTIESTVTPLASDQVQVALRLGGVTAVDGATIHYSLSGPGQITAQEEAPLPQGQVSIRRVTVRLAPGDEHYLNVFTRQNDRSAVISIALDKNPVQKKAAPAPTQDWAGRSMVVVPGQLRH